MTKLVLPAFQENLFEGFISIGDVLIDANTVETITVQTEERCKQDGHQVGIFISFLSKEKLFLKDEQAIMFVEKYNWFITFEEQYEQTLTVGKTD